jgi:hypothetical protein
MHKYTHVYTYSTYMYILYTYSLHGDASDTLDKELLWLPFDRGVDLILVVVMNG